MGDRLNGMMAQHMAMTERDMGLCPEDLSMVYTGRKAVAKD